MRTLLLLFISFQVFGQQFINSSTSNLPLGQTQFNTMDVESFDADGDGDLDLVLAMEFKKNVLLFNNGGTFIYLNNKAFPTTHVYGNPAITGEDSEDIGLADFDLDGDIDIIFATEDTDYHEYLLNDGSGKFTLANYQFPKILNANGILVIDVNSDSLMDVIFGNSGQNELFINLGNNLFEKDTSGILPVSPDFTQDLKAYDIDGDNDLDIVEGIENGGNNLYINNGTNFVLSNTNLPLANNLMTRKVVGGDIDADGDIDLYYCNTNWDPANDPIDKVLINDGNGNFTVATNRIPTFSETTLDAIFVDVNNDNYLDLITCVYNTSRAYRVFLNSDQLPGYFIEQNSILPGNFTANVISGESADFNGDSLPDFYFGVTGSSDYLYLSVNSTSLVDEKFDAEIIINPNPIQKSLLVETELEYDRIEILDINGKVVLESNFKKQYDLSSIKRGIYFVSVLLGNETLAKKKILKE